MYNDSLMETTASALWDGVMASKVMQGAKTAVIAAARLASSVQQAVLRTSGAAQAKADASPVTIGDFGAQAVISHVLQVHTASAALPPFRLLAEEDSHTLRRSAPQLQISVVDAVNSTLSACEPQYQRAAPFTLADVSALIDAGAMPDGPAGESSFFILDPIDGTRGFLRDGQWAVGLAYVVCGQTVLCAIACPNLPFEEAAGSGGAGNPPAASPEGRSTVISEVSKAVPPGSVRGSLFFAVAGRGAYAEPLPDLLGEGAAAVGGAATADGAAADGAASAAPTGGAGAAAVAPSPPSASAAAADAPAWARGAVRLRVSDVGLGPAALLAESFEGSKGGRRSDASIVCRAAGFTRGLPAHEHDPSAAAAGASASAPVAAPKWSVQTDSMVKYCLVASGRADAYMRLLGLGAECVWDHAPGALLVAEAGGRVTDGRGMPLQPALGRRLEANDGVIASNGWLHDALVAAAIAEGFAAPL